MEIFGERLKELRLKKKLTQAQAATALGLKDDGHYRQYESGRTVPGADKIRLAADYFNVTTDYLLGRTDNPHCTCSKQQ